MQTIEKQYLSASGKTNALHQACEQLVQEQTDLVTFNESINERLSYFVELEGTATSTSLWSISHVSMASHTRRVSHSS